MMDDTLTHNSIIHLVMQLSIIFTFAFAAGA